MQNDDRLTPMEKELEAALGGLTPSAAAMGRDGVMFAAGQASMRRRHHLWRGFSGVLAILLLASTIWRPAPAEPEQHVITIAYETPVAIQTPPPIEPVGRHGAEAFRRYVRTRQAILNRGIEAIPVTPPSRNGLDGTLSRKDLEELLSEA